MVDHTEKLFNDLEQRYVLLKNEFDHVCIERDSYKSNKINVLLHDI